MAPADKADEDQAIAGKVSDLVAASDRKAATELAALKPGFAANQLNTASNDAIVNFPTGGTEVPDSTIAFLQSAAGHLIELGK